VLDFAFEVRPHFVPWCRLEHEKLGFALGVLEVSERLDAVSDVGIRGGETCRIGCERPAEAPAIRSANEKKIDEVFARAPRRNGFDLGRERLRRPGRTPVSLLMLG